jgi:hypothetical protein
MVYYNLKSCFTHSRLSHISHLGIQNAGKEAVMTIKKVTKKMAVTCKCKSSC